MNADRPSLRSHGGPMTTGLIRKVLFSASMLLLAFGVARFPVGHSAESSVSLAAPLLDNPKAAGAPQVAVLSGGCFWGVQGVFQHVRGVRQVLSGYSGGEAATAEYEAVSSGRPRHA